MTYNLTFRVTLNDGSNRNFPLTHLEDTTVSVNLPEELGLIYWEEPLEVLWWVAAHSGDDVVQCERSFYFTIEPYTGVEDRMFSGIPEEYAIAAAYPNPFNPRLTAVIGLPQASSLRVSVFNIVGQEVAVLADGRFNHGYHTFTFDARTLCSGIYFIQAISPGKLNEMRKVVLVR